MRRIARIVAVVESTEHTAIMEFQVLGPVELSNAGQKRALESGKVSGILAILLLTPGTVVRADDLIDRLWETNPPAGARGNLSVYVSRLRASLRRAGGNGTTLTARAGGYVLDVDPGDVDLHQFRCLRRLGVAAGSAGQSAEAVLLRDADRLWRGLAMAGISGEWFAAIRDSLQEERRAAVVERIDLELDLGRHISLVGELAGLLAEYPMDERLIGCQMIALYRCGRISERRALDPKGLADARHADKPEAAETGSAGENAGNGTWIPGHRRGVRAPIRSATASRLAGSLRVEPSGGRRQDQ